VLYRGGRERRTMRWTDRVAEGLPVPLTILIHELDELRGSALKACGLRFRESLQAALTQGELFCI